MTATPHPAAARTLDWAIRTVPSLLLQVIDHRSLAERLDQLAPVTDADLEYSRLLHAHESLLALALDRCTVEEVAGRLPSLHHKRPYNVRPSTPTAAQTQVLQHLNREARIHGALTPAPERALALALVITRLVPLRDDLYRADALHSAFENVLDRYPRTALENAHHETLDAS
ncbi:hypothetical protein ASF48_17650 [Rathayibacter sp. Leaf299]|uniref:hypothetical protein n=1 Tax=Rathayibacter sp. Leaf299 TaxID=1736328 RepID=UPI0006F6D04A|nr:hypothetical protein [Rathayibacter sp. Leaf299]KQQ18744.1 hypothetical protein ASF48_17650 [Rathayibacter sp. Leaf299]